MANKWVYTFKEGNMTMRNLLGGKGANLAEKSVFRYHRVSLSVQKHVRSIMKMAVKSMMRLWLRQWKVLNGWRK